MKSRLQCKRKIQPRLPLFLHKRSQQVCVYPGLRFGPRSEWLIVCSQRRHKEEQETEARRGKTWAVFDEILRPKWWRGAVKRLKLSLSSNAKASSAFLSEAAHTRAELRFPNARHVLRLSVIALLTTVFLMSVLYCLDFVFFTLIGRRVLLKNVAS